MNHHLVAVGLVLACSGCGHQRERSLRYASRDLGQAIARRDAERLDELTLPATRAIRNNAALLGDQRKAWAKSLAKPEAVRAEATILLAPDLPVRVVLTDEGWLLGEDPTDIYAQDTPRHAVRALVLASRNERWDIVLRLAPQRYRTGLSAGDLAESWSEGEYANTLKAAREAIAGHLTDPIEGDADEAILTVAPDHRVQLEREGSRWVIADFLPD